MDRDISTVKDFFGLTTRYYVVFGMSLVISFCLVLAVCGYLNSLTIPSTEPTVAEFLAAHEESEIEVEIRPTTKEEKTLLPPRLSVPGGDYAISFFDIKLFIHDPNIDIKTKIMYSVDHEPWQEYESPLTVRPNQTIRAVTTSKITEFLESEQTIATYKPIEQTLDEPKLSVRHLLVGQHKLKAIQVTLDNPNRPYTSYMQYRINRGKWREYIAPFNIQQSLYRGSIHFEAQAVPVKEHYHASRLATMMESL